MKTLAIDLGSMPKMSIVALHPAPAEIVIHSKHDDRPEKFLKSIAESLAKKTKKRYVNPATKEVFYADNVYEGTPSQRLSPKVLKRRAANRKKRKANKRRN